MNKLLVNIICLFMLKKKNRHKFREKYSDYETNNEIKNYIAYQYALPFINAKAKKNTICVMEFYCHYEVIPSIIKYLLDLGYNVHLFVKNEQNSLNSLINCDFPTDNFQIFTIPKFVNRDEVFNSLLQYKHIFLLTSLFEIHKVFYERYVKQFGKDNFTYISHHFNHSPEVPIGEESENFFVKHNRIFTLRDKIKYGEKTVPFFYPIYFGSINITPKNKVVRFISTGTWTKGVRNFDTLFESMKKLIANNITNFVVEIVGKINFDITGLEKYFYSKGKVSFADMYESMEQSDYLLFLLDKNMDIGTYNRYLKYATTGTLGLAVGFQKVSLITNELGELYGLDSSRAINYNDDDLYDAMKTAIEMGDEEYLKKQNNLGKYKDELMKKSVENLDKYINEVK
ncbi:MAG: hypothetical protein Ta2D_02100 [Rickettsiales bacterium]|nr:MAG: hypothetical protein Ta2D_02100 [Rickettsiales bacterium]